jgi:hypothetical protein
MSNESSVRRMGLPSQWRNGNHVSPWPAELDRWSRPSHAVAVGPAQFHTVTVSGVIDFDNRKHLATAMLGCTPFQQETMVSTRDENAVLLTWNRRLGGDDRLEFTVVGTVAQDRSLHACLRMICRIDEVHGGPQLETFRSWDVSVPVDCVVDVVIEMTDNKEPCGYICGSIGNVGG